MKTLIFVESANAFNALITHVCLRVPPFAYIKYTYRRWTYHSRRHVIHIWYWTSKCNAHHASQCDNDTPLQFIYNSNLCDLCVTCMSFNCDVLSSSNATEAHSDGNASNLEKFPETWVKNCIYLYVCVWIMISANRLSRRVSE